MKPFRLFSFFVAFSAIISCKNNSEKPGIEERSDVREIAAITSSSALREILSGNEFQSGLLSDSAEIKYFYESNSNAPIWSDRELRESLFRNIEHIDDEGLFPEEYNYEILKKRLSHLDKNTKTQNTALEILLTDAFFQLSKHLNSGKLDPEDIHEIWGTTQNQVDVKGLLKWAISKQDIASALDSVRPKSQVYLGLKKSLKAIRQTGLEEKEERTQLETGKLIKPGENNTRIANISKRFVEMGYLEKAEDSTYTEDLELAVKNLQKEYGLHVDGVIGNSTISILNTTRKDRYHQILVNLERWRWYPKNLGSQYIIVNIPDYRLYVVKNGDTIRSHRTMVGTEARKTPVFSEKVAYIVYNPTWTIPPTIKKKDVIPQASKDISYLNRKNIAVYDNGEQLDPENIDWSEASKYTYTQKAGPTNPLGQVKIIYPNQYLIYLHDTPSRKLFERNVRAQSSGCVRVQGVLDLAKYLLDNQSQYGQSKIDSILDSGKTTQIKVTKDVQVHHFYWTAYRENDETKFIPDIYNIDEKIWQMLKPNSN